MPAAIPMRLGQFLWRCSQVWCLMWCGRRGEQGGSTHEDLRGLMMTRTGTAGQKESQPESSPAIILERRGMLQPRCDAHTIIHTYAINLNWIPCEPEPPGTA